MRELNNIEISEVDGGVAVDPLFAGAETGFMSTESLTLSQAFMDAIANYGAGHH